jgi:hypothetical protein
MNENDPTNFDDTTSAHSIPSATSSGRSVAERVGDASSAPPSPQTAWPDGSASVTQAKRPRLRKVRQLLLAAAVTSPVIGLSVGLCDVPIGLSGATRVRKPARRRSRTRRRGI